MLKHVIVMPDSFKGSISSREAAQLIKDEILAVYPMCQVDAIPVADGGEGSVECFLTSLGGNRIFCSVKGPFGDPVQASYGMLGDGETAVVEMAAAAGLPLAEGRLNPLLATTYGVGELMSDALQKGAKKLILCLGGSATNDFGAGAAAALGCRFLNAEGSEFVPTGGTLEEVKEIDTVPLRQRLDGVEVIAVCDVDHPLCGPDGASAVFGPQKGATPDMVKQLDEGMSSIASLVKERLGIDCTTLAGAGAAGGMGGGAYALLGAKLVSGIDTLLDAVHFETRARGADLVLTGEGRIDGQSARGKVVSGIAARAKALSIPVIVIAGDIADGAESCYEEGVSAILSTNREAKPFEDVKPRAKEDLARIVETLMRLSKIFSRD